MKDIHLPQDIEDDFAKDVSKGMRILRMAQDATGIPSSS
jgi:hypothetical protein